MWHVSDDDDLFKVRRRRPLQSGPAHDLEAENAMLTQRCSAWRTSTWTGGMLTGQGRRCGTALSPVMFPLFVRSSRLRRGRACAAQATCGVK